MRTYLFPVILGLILMVSGCTSSAKVVTAPLGTGENVIEMNASSFDFDPDIIRARQGDRLILFINNVAGMEHNITIESPDGEVLVTRNLPERETVRVEVPLSNSGEYPYYCNKLMHPLLGMKGHLEVEN